VLAWVSQKGRQNRNRALRQAVGAFLYRPGD
jgi:hypothetical protein